MSRRAGAAPLLPVAVTLVLIVSVLFIFPLSPSLTVTFRISSTPSSPFYAISVNSTLSATFYEKSAIGIGPKGFIDLSTINGVTGNYNLTVAITYSGQVLSNQTLSRLNFGTYRITVTYWPRVESSGSAYIIQLRLSVPGQQNVTNATITFPT